MASNRAFRAFKNQDKEGKVKVANQVNLNLEIQPEIDSTVGEVVKAANRTNEGEFVPK